MHMALAAHRFFSEFSRCVDHRAKEEHSSFEFGSNLIAADVHYDGISRIRPGAGGVAQTWPNRVERALFWLRAKHSRFIAKSQRLANRNYIDAGIESHASILTEARMVAHCCTPSAGLMRYLPVFAGTINVSA